MDFVTVSTGLILPYWMGLPIRYIQLLRLIKFAQLAIMLVTIAFSSKFKFRNSFKELQFSTYREYNKQLEQKRDLDKQRA